MLTEKQLREIKQLQEVCEQDGGFQLKLNYDMLENREEARVEDFFHYEGNLLVGFLGSYNFGNKVELCGMVHPDFRRRGIFSSLLKVGLEEAMKHDIQTILLNAPTESLTAKAFLKTVPCTFAVAEYQMKWHQKDLINDDSVIVRPSVSKEDWDAEIKLEISGFGMSEKQAQEMQKNISEQSSDQKIIIEVEGRIAGKMRVSELNGEAWIYGFAVYPELRGKGIGRKALSKVVIMEQQKGLPVFLEVEAKNAHALRLYESCGFKTYHSQDYYKYNQ
ncbi:GNAT family N-acetyltransferase [Mesobacillus maritimus]|uniref:GNAT family N-acetyltransferase n=1 Tax=Mesobacillus maritimus TaxID=1643336 RepID=UPI00384AB20B